MKKLLFLLVMSLIVVSTTAEPSQKRRKKKAKTNATSPDKPAKGSIEAVIKDSIEIDRTGMFGIAEQDDKYYFLIPTKLLKRDIIVVNRISQSAAGIRSGFAGYAGDKVQEAMVRFVESPNGKNVFIQNIITIELPRDSVGEMRDAVLRSNFQPIVASFKIEGRNKAKDTILIDATKYINSDNSLVSIRPSIKKGLNISNFQSDKSYISSVKSYPTNVEIKSVKTFNYTPKFGSFSGETRTTTFEINSSMVLLPEVAMKPRYADDRVGYFTDRYIDYEKNPQGVKQVAMISRFRLEPKVEELERYMKGELVEPIKPIIYYIDPATPKKWIPYLIQGVNDWQEAFEQAGFKNAIIGKEAPTFEEDSTWSLEDARYSAIVYKPSHVSNASGPHVGDPRSGENIETHVNWYHNVQFLLRNWYMIQVGPNDTLAQQMIFPDELMGELIRFVSSHEVGHTLGLKHNMGASSLTPVDSLRSATYLKKYGHTPSIMDYSRFNYAVQPEDNIEPSLLYPRIQDYDKWAIEFGYRYLPQFDTADDETTFLNEWVIEKSKNPRLWFGHEMNSDDPRSQTEDLGDNQMKANALGIKNLKRVLEGIPEWTQMANENYSNLGMLYNEVVSQFNRYIGHVAKWVGGIYETPKTIEQGGNVYSYVASHKQKEAMLWLNNNVFRDIQWIVQPEIYAKTGIKIETVYNKIYTTALQALLSERVINNLAQAQLNGFKTYTSQKLFTDLNYYIWSHLNVSNAKRRALQRVYVDKLSVLLTAVETNPYSQTETKAIVNYEVRNLLKKLKATRVTDPIAQGHYASLTMQLERLLNSSNNLKAKGSY